MSSKGSDSNSQVIYLAPRFSVRGTKKELFIRDLDGFAHKNSDRGELITNTHLTTTPIVRKVGNRYHLINHDHHGLASQLDQLSNSSSIWVFLLEEDNDLDIVEKIRFFTQLSLVQYSSLTSKFANQFIQQIAANNKYQSWLNDHLGLKMFSGKPSDQCPINAASLASILGIRTEKRVKDHLSIGWKSKDGSGSSDDIKPSENGAYLELNIEDAQSSPYEPNDVVEFPTAPDTTKLESAIQDQVKEHSIEPTGDDNTLFAAAHQNSAIEQHSPESDISVGFHSGEPSPTIEIWNNFASAKGLPDYEAWVSYLKRDYSDDHAERFIQRIVESNGEIEELQKLASNLETKVGLPTNV